MKFLLFYTALIMVLVMVIIGRLKGIWSIHYVHVTEDMKKV